MWANEPQSTSQIIHLSVHVMLCVTAAAVPQKKEEKVPGKKRNGGGIVRSFHP